MSMGLERIREKLAEYLTKQGVSAAAAWPVKEREKLTGAVAAVSLRGCSAGPSGFQDYLGERYDADSGQWQELYGRKAELTFGLDLYAPPSLGEEGLQAAFDKLMEALAGGRPSGPGPAGLTLREVSCGETGYDAAGRLLKRSVQAVFDTYLYAVTEPGGAFLDFEIQGDEK